MTLLDTGPLVAALDRRESNHRWATGVFEELREPLWTCGAVLSEASFLLGLHPPAVARLRGLVRDGVIRPATEDAPLWHRAFALMERYANVPMSFADACLVALAESMPGASIFTLDRDFLIYRQQDDQPLPLLAPFAQ
jgi:predicted nucleic acid-binding protein